MHILEMVCPNLKELEGVAQEPVLENRAFFRGITSLRLASSDKWKAPLVYHSFLYVLHSIFVVFNVMHNSMF